MEIKIEKSLTHFPHFAYLKKVSECLSTVHVCRNEESVSFDVIESGGLSPSLKFYKVNIFSREK